ncbi:hypothetical protein FQN50_008755 [Emmonsiellopsis sp. PD_5]|nr:hypothetical protein FQN50_008755 [Emmonsiellopsis sp. PD_5]
MDESFRAPKRAPFMKQPSASLPNDTSQQPQRCCGSKHTLSFILCISPTFETPHAMDPLSVTASIITILQLTSKTIEYLNDVKDAPRDRAQCAIEASNLYNLLLTLRYRLEEGASHEPWYAGVRALSVKDGPLDQYKFTLEQLQAKILKGRGMNKVGYYLMWKLIKEDVMNMMVRIERLKSLVQIALEMDHFKLSRAIGKGVDAVQQDQSRQWHEEILEWISPTDFPAQQSDFISSIQEGTGLWFLESAEFIKWIHGSEKTLFCPGIPGAGKTMCNYKVQADQTTIDLLAAILKQLLPTSPSMMEPVIQLYDQHARKGTRPSLDNIVGVLQSVLASQSRVYLVVDALDECSDDKGTCSQLLDKLRALQSETSLHLMVTSRWIPEIVSEFKSAPTLEVRASEADVKRFVRGQMYRLPGCVQRDNALQLMVQEKLVQAADGMFLLARLHFDSLLDQYTKKKVLSALDKLAKGSGALHLAYDEAIKTIENQLPGKAVLAKSVLSWITYAKRPLTTEELCHALAVELGEVELDPDNIPDVEDLVSVCAGLVTVDQESNIIRLVHYTTQEYFEQIREHWNSAAHQEIASICLTYLSFNTFRRGSCTNDDDFTNRIHQNPFVDYAARYWGQHALTVQAEVSELALSLLRHDNLVSSAVQMMTLSARTRRPPNWSQYYPNQSVGLHLTARFGLLHLSQKLLDVQGEDNGIFADPKDGEYRTPLSWAAAAGHEIIVQMLVDRDDRARVVKLLTDRDDVEADSKDKYGCTPLALAASGGHAEVVKLLADRDDVEADSKDEDGFTPLGNAAWYGHTTVLKLMVDRDDVEADSKDKHGFTPLKYAAMFGHATVVKLLADRDDVDVNSKDEDGSTPLKWAKRRGHDAVVMLLRSKLDGRQPI